MKERKSDEEKKTTMRENETRKEMVMSRFSVVVVVPQFYSANACKTKIHRGPRRRRLTERREEKKVIFFMLDCLAEHRATTENNFK